MKRLLVLTLALITTNSYSGAGSSGGAQGIVDQSGAIYFLDIMTPSEIKKLSSTVIDNSKVKLVGDINCTDVWYNHLMSFNEKKHQIQKQQYPNGVNYQNEVNEAKNLLQLAGSVLDNNLIKANFEEFIIERSFKLTALPLSKLEDASSIDKKYQTQIAYFHDGMTFFQVQALEKLKDKTRAVFIKEGLRQARLFLNLSLTNRDLEIATRYIYKGELEKFSNSSFAKEYNNLIPVNDFQYGWQVPAVIYKSSEDWTSLAPEKHQFSMMVGMDRYAPGHKRHKRYTPKLNDIWSTESGKLVDANECGLGEK